MPDFYTLVTAYRCITKTGRSSTARTPNVDICTTSDAARRRHIKRTPRRLQSTRTHTITRRHALKRPVKSTSKMGAKGTVRASKLDPSQRVGDDPPRLGVNPGPIRSGWAVSYAPMSTLTRGSGTASAGCNPASDSNLRRRPASRTWARWPK